MSKIALILGTRPEIIKLSPVIRELKKKKRPFILIHTGQHYSYEMDALFFKELDLPRPKYRLAIASKNFSGQGDHTGRMMAAVENVLLKEKPYAVLVQGDTNSVLAGTLAAIKISGIKIGHVEAGLRSYDRAMPEEINRVLSDHVAHFLFTPTEFSKKILLGEGIPKEKIFVTGNTIVDAVKENLSIARRKVHLEKRLGKRAENFFLMTLHRQENVDQKKRLKSIVEGLDKVTRRFGVPIIFPMHPRTKKRLENFRIKLPGLIRTMSPVGFLEFLLMESKARLILTDSGGVQEEACMLKIPCVTLRTSTERPETVRVGANRISGYDPVAILKSVHSMIDKKRVWPNPFGDGRAGERIVRILERGW